MAKKAKKVYVRRLRHWKQRFNKNAEFIWRKPIIWGGKKVKPGKPIPKDLAKSPTKLRRFWESHAIELAEFEAPNIASGQKQLTFDFDIPEGVVIKQGKATWFEIHADGEEHKVNGKKALEAFVTELADNIEMDEVTKAQDEADAALKAAVEAGDVEPIEPTEPAVEAGDVEPTEPAVEPVVEPVEPVEPVVEPVVEPTVEAGDVEPTVEPVDGDDDSWLDGEKSDGK